MDTPLLPATLQVVVGGERARLPRRHPHGLRSVEKGLSLQTWQHCHVISYSSLYESRSWYSHLPRAANKFRNTSLPRSLATARGENSRARGKRGPRRRRGSALAMVMIIVCVLSVVAASLLLLVMSHYHTTFQSASWQESVFAAETGVDMAVNELRKRVVYGPGTAFGTSWTTTNPTGTA